MRLNRLGNFEVSELATLTAGIADLNLDPSTLSHVWNLNDAALENYLGLWIPVTMGVLQLGPS